MNNMKYDNMKYNIGVVSCYQYPSTLTYGGPEMCVKDLRWIWRA